MEFSLFSVSLDRTYSEMAAGFECSAFNWCCEWKSIWDELAKQLAFLDFGHCEQVKLDCFGVSGSSNLGSGIVSGYATEGKAVTGEVLPYLELGVS